MLKKGVIMCERTANVATRPFPTRFTASTGSPLCVSISASAPSATLYFCTSMLLKGRASIGTPAVIGCGFVTRHFLS